jgi:lysophospholipase L1-like esterase
MRQNPVPPLLRSWRQKLRLAALSTVLTLAALELGFRTYDALWQDLPFFWDPAAAAKKRTRLCNPFLLFRGEDTAWKTRAKTPEQVIEPNGRHLIRIACIGGSTTQDATAFHAGQITYPTELQQVLNEALASSPDVIVETLNAGFAAHSSLHSLVLLQTEIIYTRPDLLIVYHNINDLLVNYFPGPPVPAYANKFLHPFYLPPELTVAKTTWLDHSRCYTWARDRLRTVTGYGMQYTDEPIELRHAEVFRDHLRHLAAVAQVHGIPVLFGQQAAAFDRELFEKHFRTKSYNPVVRYPRMDQFEQHFRRYNAIVREVAAEQQALCADPFTALKDRPDLFADVVHLHPEGARLAGREFARVLIESGWLHETAEKKRNREPVISHQSSVN